MALSSKRLGCTPGEPHRLEVAGFLLHASGLLLHLEKLPGLEALTRKSAWITDDFEAYFTYQVRLFVKESPFALVSVVVLGEASDEALFREAEAQVRRYDRYAALSAPLAVLNYCFVRSDPSRQVLDKYGVSEPNGAKHAP